MDVTLQEDPMVSERRLRILLIRGDTKFKYSNSQPLDELILYGGLHVTYFWFVPSCTMISLCRPINCIDFSGT